MAPSRSGASDIRQQVATQYDRGGVENIPVPDPSLLTTVALQREIFSLRELLEVKLGASSDGLQLLRQIIEARLDGMDKAIELLQHISDQSPARVDEKIAALREVHEEKFNGIQGQFSERDVRTEQSSRDSKVAVDAALQAAKEAVSAQQESNSIAISKSEAAALKQIDQLSALLQAAVKGADDKIADLKDRLTRIEGERFGGGQVMAAIAVIVGLLLSAAGVIIAFILHSPR